MITDDGKRRSSEDQSMDGMKLGTTICVSGVRAGETVGAGEWHMITRDENWVQEPER